MQDENQVSVSARDLEPRVFAALTGAGASTASAQAAVRAMMHASQIGVDSHGVRLTEHYCRMLRGGRINPDPDVKVRHTAAASAMVNGDDGLGHYAAYMAVQAGAEMAREAGIAALGIEHSSHFGAAGAYAVAGAEQGFITFATTNTDAMVTPYHGAKRFHGTNPLAFAAPVPSGRPWMLDMATSSIPMNRVLLQRSLGGSLPPGVAADAEGEPTTDPNAVDMLLPLGGEEYGYKGAGLAGVATLFSALLTGTTLDPDFIPMYGTDNIHQPRNMGHFILLIDPAKFVGAQQFAQGIHMYLSALRGTEARPESRVMAPGDREWAEAERRQVDGIPLDPDTARFLDF